MRCRWSCREIRIELTKSAGIPRPRDEIKSTPMRHLWALLIAVLGWCLPMLPSWIHWTSLGWQSIESFSRSAMVDTLNLWCRIAGLLRVFFSGIQDTQSQDSATSSRGVPGRGLQGAGSELVGIFARTARFRCTMGRDL